MTGGAFSPRKVFQSEKCTGCGICSLVCPASAIRVDEQGKVVSFSASCIGCGHCGCYCPENCYGLPRSPLHDNLPSEDQIQSLFKSRRSTRRFTDREIDETVLSSLLATVGFSPTGRNAGGITVQVILGRSEINRLVLNPVVKVVKFLDCCRLLTIMAGPARPFLRKLKQGEDIINWNAPCMLLFRVPASNPTGRSDTVIAATMVSLKAEAMGLGSFWNGVVQMLSPFLPVKKCSAVLCVGYPALKKFQSVPPREWSRS